MKVLQQHLSAKSDFWWCSGNVSRQHLNFYRKQTDGWDFTSHFLEGYGLSVGSKIPTAFPWGAPSLSYSLTPKPEAPNLLTAAEEYQDGTACFTWRGQGLKNWAENAVGHPVGQWLLWELLHFSKIRIGHIWVFISNAEGFAFEIFDTIQAKAPPSFSVQALLFNLTISAGWRHSLRQLYCSAESHLAWLHASAVKAGSAVHKITPPQMPGKEDGLGSRGEVFLVWIVVVARFILQYPQSCCLTAILTWNLHVVQA